MSRITKVLRVVLVLLAIAAVPLYAQVKNDPMSPLSVRLMKMAGFVDCCKDGQCVVNGCWIIGDCNDSDDCEVTGG